jgi:DNA-directed RNA polymerase specialized sigma subunit
MEKKYDGYVSNQFKKDERRRNYLEKDMKRGKIIIDAENEKITFISSKEDSYERLSESGVEFIEENSDPSEIFDKKQDLEQLCKALGTLEKEEYELIYELFYEDKSERFCAECRNISKQAINKKKMLILNKLKRIINKI